MLAAGVLVLFVLCSCRRTLLPRSFPPPGISALAQEHSLDSTYLSPYILEARQQPGLDLGIGWFEKVILKKEPLGGKPDDITCVVGEWSRVALRRVLVSSRSRCMRADET